MPSPGNEREIVFRSAVCGKSASVLDGSIIAPYLDASGELSSPEAFEKAHNAFVAESMECLKLFTADAPPAPARVELIRPFVVKVLLYIGYLPKESSFALVAQLITMLAQYPGSDIQSLVGAISAHSGVSVPSLMNTVEKSFDLCDARMSERITFLTGFTPLTSAEIITDLALYVRSSALKSTER